MFGDHNYIFIVGNGFDLNLGLKSNFWDFIVYHYFNNDEELIVKLYDQYLQTHDEFIVLLHFLFPDPDKPNLNKQGHISFAEFCKKLESNFFIFLYLYHNFCLQENKGSGNCLENIRKHKWSDVESTLSSILTEGEKTNWYAHLKNSVLNNRINLNIQLLQMGYRYFIDDQDKISWYLSQPQQYITLIKDSLQQFENEFHNYILSETKKDNFNEKFHTQWTKLIYNFVSNENFSDNHIVCLSFNYTIGDIKEIKKKLDTKRHIEKKLPQWECDYVNNYIRYINIHGHIIKKESDKQASTIIGIDDSKNSNDFKFYEFTKSYKIAKMRANTANNNSLLFFGKNLNNLDIYFYGHSLSDNDYSYFQSLFDKFDLYSSNVVLHFIYPADENNEDHSKFCDFSKIYNLIHKYGLSFTNKDKGKNLFSKLLLEDRLKIHFLKDLNKF